MALLPPPPVTNNPSDPSFRDWFYKVQQVLAVAGSINFTDLNFTGSNLTSLATANHNDLDSIQGGSASQYYHLTSAEYTGTGTGNFVRASNPTIASPNIDNIDFDVAGSTGAERRLTWDSGDGSLSLGLEGGNVTLKLGQAEYQYCYNGNGGTVSIGTVVQITGAQGNRIKFDKAKADAEATSIHTFGFVAESIALGAEGFVLTGGMLRGIATTTDSDGNALSAGDTLYLSPNTSGGFTNVRPTAPNHAVIVGFVVRVHASAGEIFVKIDNGYEIDELHNVSITTPAAGSVLVYNDTTNVWQDATITAGTNVTITNADGSITIAASGGVTQVKVYEPIIDTAGSALLWDSVNGDVIMAWGGSYAA